jgi:hypothetical protein
MARPTVPLEVLDRWPKVRKARENRERVAARHLAAKRHVEECEAAIATAERDYAERASDAILAGRAEPKRDVGRDEELATALRDAQRAAGVEELAEKKAAQALEQALAEHAAEAAATWVVERDALRREYAKAVQHALDLRLEHEKLVALAAWASQYPNRPYKPHSLATVPISALVKANGESWSVEDVYAVLLDEAGPAEPQPAEDLEAVSS